MKKAIDQAEAKLHGRKLTKEEREAEIEKQRSHLKEMERDRKKNEKSEQREAHMAAVRAQLKYEDEHLGERVFEGTLSAALGCSTVICGLLWLFLLLFAVLIWLCYQEASSECFPTR